MNVSGNSASLTPFESGNVAALRHGVYSPRVRREREEQLVQTLLGEPQVELADSVALYELARLLTLAERLDDAIESGGVMNAKSGSVRAVIDLRLRTSRRLQELTDRLALNPKARAAWAQSLGGASLASELQRRLRGGGE